MTIWVGKVAEMVLQDHLLMVENAVGRPKDVAEGALLALELGHVVTTLEPLEVNNNGFSVCLNTLVYDKQHCQITGTSDIF
jgi:hypothetical protein